MRLLNLPIMTTSAIGPSVMRLVLAGIVLAGCARSASAVVRAEIVHFGFPGAMGPVYRVGAWLPVVVDVSLENQQHFAGFLRIEQFDKDGDLCRNQVPVSLLADTGGRRRYWLYTLANPRRHRADGLRVQLLDEDERAVNVVCQGRESRYITAAAPPEDIGWETRLILDLSEGIPSGVEDLARADQAGEWHEVVKVARLSAAGLPDRWQGLEVVDAIIWDRADPSRMSPAQLQALAEWVRMGGFLVIAASRTADTLARSTLGEILPVRINGVLATQSLPDSQKQLLAMTAETTYPTQIPAARAEVREGAWKLYSERSLDSDIATRRRVGRGSVIFLAVTIRDLCAGLEVDRTKLFSRLLELKSAHDAEGFGQMQTASLTSPLQTAVGFSTATVTYLFAAVIFGGAYVLLASIGSWGVLRQRGWLKQSWLVFALVAALASVFSVGAVQAIRGVGRTLHQLTIVDGEFGSTFVTATCYLGLKTGTHSSLDVWLSEDFPQQTEPKRSICTIKPLAQDPHAPASSYSASLEYDLDPSQASLLGVPIRATLKQFEGRWQGTMDGKLTGKIHFDSLGITRGSTIKNDLGIDLEECYLLAANQDMTYANSMALLPSRSLEIQIHPLGAIPNGAEIDAFRLTAFDAAGNPFTDEELRKNRKSLARTHTSLAKDLAGVISLDFLADKPQLSDSDIRNALLMLSTFNEYDPVGTDERAPLFVRPNCRHLDVSSLLTRQTAMLIGFSNTAGPVRLCVRSGQQPFRAVQPDAAQTMYRILLPAVYSGNVREAKTD